MRYLLALVLLLGACRSEPTPPAESATPAAPTGTFTIVHVGDINLAEDVTPRLEKDGADFMFRKVREHLEGDFLIGNLESVVANTPAAKKIDKGSIHLMDPKYIAALQAEGFDLVTIANNHAMDQRGPALIEMVGHLDAAGLPHIGAGANLADAKKAHIIEGAGLKIAVIGMYWYSSQKEKLNWYAGEDKPGVWPIKRGDVAREVKKLRAEGVDFVLASVHWGPNYVNEVGKLKKLARDLETAGVDAVSGHGAHIQQGTAFVDGMPVLYGIGNFAFGSKGIYSKKSPNNRLSSIARWVFEDRKLKQVELLPIRTDNKKVGFQPRPAGAKQAKEQFEPTLSRYGIEWSKRDDGWYVVPVPQ
jgi:poly-gamma-glutamate capsule biosynthesis protein CapA/YwtB (metallophosphatase superfamily)